MKLSKKQHHIKMTPQSIFLNKIARLFAGISQEQISTAGSLLGSFAYMFDVRHRRIVRRNLHFAYPELPRRKIEQLSKAVFENIGVTFLEICQIPFLPKNALISKVTIKGKSNLMNAINSNRSIILFSGHIGSWELGLQVISHYTHKNILLIAQHIKSKLLNTWVYKLRAGSDNSLIDKKGALPQMVRTLRKGGIIGLLIDQGTKVSQGVEIKFFNKTTTATPVVAVLARRYNSIVLPVFCVREKNGGVTLLIEEPVLLVKTNNLEDDAKTNTQIMTNIIERIVRLYPDQWFWFHKRWKRSYPYLYREDIAKRKRLREKRRAADKKA